MKSVCIQTKRAVWLLGLEFRTLKFKLWNKMTGMEQNGHWLSWFAFDPLNLNLRSEITALNRFYDHISRYRLQWSCMSPLKCYSHFDLIWSLFGKLTSWTLMAAHFMHLVVLWTMFHNMESIYMPRGYAIRGDSQTNRKLYPTRVSNPQSCSPEQCRYFLESSNRTVAIRRSNFAP